MMSDGDDGEARGRRDASPRGIEATHYMPPLPSRMPMP